jgi:hypothetical protein
MSVSPWEDQERVKKLFSELIKKDPTILDKLNNSGYYIEDEE